MEWQAVTDESKTAIDVVLHPLRFRMVATLLAGPTTIKGLADKLGVKVSSVGRHLAKLHAVGLIVESGPSWSPTYHVDESSLSGSLVRAHAGRYLGGRMEKRALNDEERIIQNFTDGTRLRSMPVVLSKKRVVLRWLARFFEPDRQYAEREVNRILERAHPDFATLRRELVDGGLMKRDHGRYWLSCR